jgi:hypothetical protein
LAIHPIDDDINAHLLGSQTADNVYRPGKYIGSTHVQIGASIGRPSMLSYVAWE